MPVLSTASMISQRLLGNQLHQQPYMELQAPSTGPGARDGHPRQAKLQTKAYLAPRDTTSTLKHSAAHQC